jgi:hypothetical protein
MSLADSTPHSGGGKTLQQSPAIISKMTERFDDMTPPSGDHIDGEELAEPTKKDGKVKKRGLFGFGKKKEDSSKSQLKTGSSTESPTVSRDISKLSSTTRSTTSPTQSEHPFILPSSPSRGLSSSPRLSSPAGSQIFERDVQESAVMPHSPAIPSHIQTENHIPPVLDASSEAITDNHLDPNDVEIITHNAHQPAAVTVTGATPSYEQVAASWAEELGVYGGSDDTASNYGSFDNTDVRRLSFISFADVVQAEHAGLAGPAGSRESMHLAGLTSLSNIGMNRSPSPIRSPVSSQGPGTSPPTSKSGSVKGLELSPTRKPLGSPTSTHHSLTVGGGELNIETMSQALRRTGSTDLSGVRSLPTSPTDGPSR